MHIDLLRVTRYATYAYLVAVPGLVESLDWLGMHDTARALQAALCSLAMLAWGQRYDLRAVQLGRAKTGLLVLAVTLALASIWQAQWPLLAATEACLWVGLIALAWVFATSPHAILTREVPGVVVVAVVLMGLLELRDIAFAWLSAYPLDVGTVGYGHANRRHFNHVQTMSLIMAAMVMWCGSERWIRWGAWLGVSVGLALIWFTGARSTSLALAVTCVAFISLTDASKGLWSSRFITTIACGALAFLVFYRWIPDLLDISIRDAETMGQRVLTTSNDRLMLWQAAWQMAAEQPLIGWGGLHFAAHTPLPLAHPHNIVLQWAAEWGWGLTLLTLVGLCWWTRPIWEASWHRLQGRPWQLSPLVTAASLATLAGLVDAMFSGTLTMPVSQVWWCVCLGLATGRSSATDPPERNSRSAVLYGSMTIAMIVVLMGATRQQSSEVEHRPSLASTSTAPRLWLQDQLPAPQNPK